MNYFYIPRTMPNEQEYQTTFHLDFDIADHFGLEGVIDTFNRAFNEWKHNIEYISELCVVMNIRSWFGFEKGNKQLAKLYEDYYYKVRDFVYDDNSPFNEKEQSYFFQMTD